MKTVLILAALCFVGTFAYKDELLKLNKTPKDGIKFTNVCEECQVIVKRFSEAARDPAKMATLKELLGLLCQETKHVTECRIIVNKLDLFIDKLLPYLKNPDVICRKFHMCSNSKLDQFHRVGLLFAKKYLTEVDGARDLICEECQFAAHELQNFVDDRETQTKVRQFLSDNVCSRLGQYRGSCDIVVDDFLPDLFQELHNMLQDPKQFCADLKLCSPRQLGFAVKPQSADEIKHTIRGPSRLRQFYKELNMLSSIKHPMVAMGCLECRVIIDGLLIELRTVKSEDNLCKDLIGAVCPALPSNLTAGCNDFLGMYGPTVINMTLYQFDSEAICTSMHSCPDGSFAAIDKLSYSDRKEATCEACRGLSKFVDAELSDPVINKELIHGLQEALCDYVPSTFKNICNNLMAGYLPLAFNKIQKAIGDGKLCTKVHAC